MKRAQTTNVFNGGLMMDLNPMVTPNDVLTGCLNGTLITFNGNENVLQNDMGNGRVETAFLPQGFIPLGTTSFGGIIYIASYNPQTGQSQIGSFPSPERNILTTELNDKSAVEILCSEFYDGNTYNVIKPRIIKDLSDKILNTGDKFQIFCSSVNLPHSILSAYAKDNTNINKCPNILKLHVVSITESGEIVYLDKNLVWYKDQGEQNFYYYIKNVKIDNENKTDLDEYRDIATSNYSVYSSRNKGHLAIIAELECISSFSVTYSAEVTYKDEKNPNEKTAKITFYLNWTYDNLEERNAVNLYGIKVTSDIDGENLTNWEKVLNHCYINKQLSTNYICKNPTSSLIKSTKEDYYVLNYNVEEVCSKDLSNRAQLEFLEKAGYIRRNDGTDPDFNLKFEPEIEYTRTEDDNEKVLHLTITPAMEFGYLKYLEQKLNIKLNKLGSGDTDLIEYRYYVENNNIIINWGLECYPEKGKQINSVNFQYAELNKFTLDNLNGIFRGKLPVKDNLTNDSWKTLFNSVGKPSYSGNFVNTIEFDENFEKNKCYLLKITLDYSNEIRYFYRILYTIPIFNSKYYEKDDFHEINLSEVYTPELVKDSGVMRINSDKEHEYFSNDGTKINIPGEYSINQDSIEGAYQEDNLKLDFKLQYKLVSPEPYKEQFNYSKVFNNFEVSIKNELINTTPSITNNASYISTGIQENLDYSIESTSSECNVKVSSSNNDIITLESPKDYNIKVKSPFNVTYGEKTDVKIDYSLQKVNTSTLKMKITFDKSYLDLAINEERVIYVPDNSIQEAYMNSNFELSSWLNKNTSDYDIIYVEFIINKREGSNCYLIRMKDGFYLTKKSGEPSDYIKNDNDLEKVRSDKLETGDIPLKGVLFRGNGDANYFVITDYHRQGKMINLTQQASKIDIKNIINNELYKWVESNEFIKLYPFKNLTYYPNYTIYITLNINNLQCELESYSICESKIDSNNANIIPNLKLDSQFSTSSSIVESYNIETNKLRDLYLKELGQIFFNDITGNITYNEDIKYPIRIVNNISEPYYNMLLNKNDLKYKLRVDSEMLKVDKVLNSKDNNTADIFWIAEYTKYKNEGKWLGSDGHKGQILKMMGVQILNAVY